jgi:2-hydroxymuconate-semialdehyde hydrolase
MSIIKSKFIDANGVRTHYLEGGTGAPLVLLHSGEFGGCSEITWEYNIEALARSFHVYAPDWLGFGKTEKLFSFEDMWGKRVSHITAFLNAVGIEKAHFIGNSMGGTMLITVATWDPCPWSLDRIVVVSGGGAIPDNSARQLLNDYDCTKDYMRRIVKELFINPKIKASEEYVERRHVFSLEPGAWECTAAVRFKAPGRKGGSMPSEPEYAKIRVPTLLLVGEKDNLRDPGYGRALQAKVPGAKLHTVKEAGHFVQIDAPDEFLAAVEDFFKTQ